MNISHEIIRIAVDPVIVVIPALIGTKFLIRTATQDVTAIKTFSFHSTNVLIKLQKIVYKRLQTTINDYEPYVIN